MFQNESPLLTEAGRACGSPAFAAGASLPTLALRADDVVPAGPPFSTRRRSEAHFPRGLRPRKAAAGFTPILTGLAGTVQWIYYPAPWPEF